MLYGNVLLEFYWKQKCPNPYDKLTFLQYWAWKPLKITGSKEASFFVAHTCSFCVLYRCFVFPSHTDSSYLVAREASAIPPIPACQNWDDSQILHSKQCPGKKQPCPPQSTQVLGSKICALAQVLIARLEDPGSPMWGQFSEALLYMQNSAEYIYPSPISNISSTVVEKQPWSPILTCSGLQKLLKKHFSHFTKCCC